MRQSLAHGVPHTTVRSYISYHMAHMIWAIRYSPNEIGSIMSIENIFVNQPRQKYSMQYHRHHWKLHRM